MTRKRRLRRAAPPDDKPSAAQPSRRAASHGTCTWLLLPAVAAVLAHCTALGGGFVWLDHAHIEAGHGLAPLSDLPVLFSRGFAETGYYRPLVAVALSIDAALADAAAGAPGPAWIYHATNLVWHACAATAVAGAARALGLARRAATLAGVLFAVHPAASLVAGAIAFRSEAMLLVALLTLLIAHLRRQPLLAAAAMLGGALTKETALALGPLFILASELHVRTRPASATAASSPRVTFIAEAIALVVAACLRVAHAPVWRAEHPALSASEAVGMRLASVWRAALALTIPVDRSLCDAAPRTAAWDALALAGLLVGALLLWLAWQRRGPALLLGLSLLPALQLVPVMRWWSLHYVYVPLAFAAMLGAQYLAQARAAVGRLASIAGLSLLAASSLLDGRRYLSDETLWRGEVQTQPACKEGHFYLAERARLRRDWPDAELHYEAALAPGTGHVAYVDRAAALQNLGLVELEQGDLDEAHDALSQALQAPLTDAARRRLLHDLALVALERGEHEQVLGLLAPEIARNDALPESLYIAAKASHALGRRAETRALILRLKKLGWSGQRTAGGDVAPR